MAAHINDDSGTSRARTLTDRLPASYAVWDLLQHPVLGDIRGRR
ncbi:hypothetical protein ACWGI1_22915 [Streptomyces sp. NPDC054835]